MRREQRRIRVCGREVESRYGKGSEWCSFPRRTDDVHKGPQPLRVESVGAAEVSEVSENKRREGEKNIAARDGGSGMDRSKAPHGIVGLVYVDVCPCDGELAGLSEQLLTIV